MSFKPCSPRAKNITAHVARLITSGAASRIWLRSDLFALLLRENSVELPRVKIDELQPVRIIPFGFTYRVLGVPVMRRDDRIDDTWRLHTAGDLDEEPRA
jgi:hypothetical protein